MALRNPLVLFIPDPWIRIGWKKTVSPINMFTMLKFISIHFSFNFFYLSPLAIRPLGDCRNHELHDTFCWHLSPNRDSRADAKLLYECRARQSDTHCLEWCVPWQSKRRQCDQQDGMGNSASPFLSKIVKIWTRINYGLSITWWRGWREVWLPVSGGLLINMVCIARMLGPTKHSTWSKI